MEEGSERAGGATRLGGRVTGCPRHVRLAEQPSLELAEEATKQNQAADFAEPLLWAGPCPVHGGHAGGCGGRCPPQSRAAPRGFEAVFLHARRC